MNPTFAATATNFQWKLHAIQQRADVVKAIEQGPFDFVLLDTRGREAFAFDHIAGAWCVQLEELDVARRMDRP
jgi:hypothetical protein